MIAQRLQVLKSPLQQVNRALAVRLYAEMQLLLCGMWYRITAKVDLRVAGYNCF